MSYFQEVAECPVHGRQGGGSGGSVGGGGSGGVETSTLLPPTKTPGERLMRKYESIDATLSYPPSSFSIGKDIGGIVVEA